MGFDPISFLLGSKAGGGGSSPWTKLAEQDFTVNTSSTSVRDVGTINCGDAVWTSAKIVYVRVRDKAGKRDGYFLGTDSFFINPNTAASTPYSIVTPIIIRYINNEFKTASNTQGVYPSEIQSNGDIPIKSKYFSSITSTINGIFHVEVYTLEWPDNVSPFA